MYRLKKKKKNKKIKKAGEETKKSCVSVSK
jgi:hypothetical protein